MDPGVPVPKTPYAQLSVAARETLCGARGRATFSEVRAEMAEAHRFRYVFTDPYIPKAPSKTAVDQCGDCKDKALWLASRLGDRTIRFVIGRVRPESRISHAWLNWQDSAGKWWVLDPTNYSSPIPEKSIKSNGYRPTYSFDGARNYAHGGARTTAVGARY